MGCYIKSATFVAGSPNLLSLPKSDLPEVAILGRSNVGKSSLINRMTNNSKLARTSATPGRTQELNFFAINLVRGRQELPFHLVDLPGYGFAKYSREKREQLNLDTVRYATERKQLKAMLILNDSNRMPEDDELALQELAFKGGKHAIIILTKCERLKRQELNRQVNEIAQIYCLAPQDLVITGEKIDVDPLLERLWLILAEA